MFLARGDVPEYHFARAVQHAGGGGKQLAVRGKGDMLNPVAVPFQDRQRLLVGVSKGDDAETRSQEVNRRKDSDEFVVSHAGLASKEGNGGFPCLARHPF